MLERRFAVIDTDDAHPFRYLPAETARWSTITQIYEGTNQIQRMVMPRQLLKGLLSATDLRILEPVSRETGLWGTGEQRKPRERAGHGEVYKAEEHERRG